MSVDLRIFKRPKLNIVIDPCYQPKLLHQQSFILHSSRVKQWPVWTCHQMPRRLYSSCPSISVSRGPGYKQTLIKIWLKCPSLNQLLIKGSPAHALCRTLCQHLLCFETSVLSVRLSPAKPQPHSSLCRRCAPFSAPAIITPFSYLSGRLHTVCKWSLLALEL